MTAKLVLPENASPKWRLAFGFLEDRWNTKRRVVDAKAVAMAIMPHLPGVWGISADAARWEGEGHDGGAFHRFPIERVADGLTLHVSSETHNGREFGARFSLGNYRDARGEVITIRVGGNSIEPAARVNLEKRDPAAVAKDIIRRVIKPGEDVLVSIRLRQENVAKAVAERDVLLAKLAALPGVEVRPHWSGGKSHHILAGPLTATLSDYGGFSVDRVSGLSSHADIIELCKMLGEFGRR